MKDWNVVITAKGHQFRDARRALRAIGPVERTGFYNVLVMKVDDPESIVRRVEQLMADHPELSDAVAHVFSAERCFDFSTVAEFEEKARETVVGWAPRIAGRTFHVRMHRRGGKQLMHSTDEERAIADALLAAVPAAEQPARVSFEDPDAIVLVETVGSRAGLAMRMREDRRQHPLLAAR